MSALSHTQVAPFVEVDARALMFTEATAPSMLEGELDLVIDCIDDVETKAALLAQCVQRGIKVLAAMGAGAKADPTHFT